MKKIKFWKTLLIFTTIGVVLSVIFGIKAAYFDETQTPAQLLLREATLGSATPAKLFMEEAIPGSVFSFFVSLILASSLKLINFFSRLGKGKKDVPSDTPSPGIVRKLAPGCAAIPLGALIGALFGVLLVGLASFGGQTNDQDMVVGGVAGGLIGTLGGFFFGMIALAGFNVFKKLFSGRK
ncbi:MAG: hypothetical protein GY780_17325 [bacterium]|nr:hypothetical protein [bacterium]